MKSFGLRSAESSPTSHRIGVRISVLRESGIGTGSLLQNLADFQRLKRLCHNPKPAEKVE